MSALNEVNIDAQDNDFTGPMGGRRGFEAGQKISYDYVTFSVPSIFIVFA